MSCCENGIRVPDGANHDLPVISVIGDPTESRDRQALGKRLNRVNCYLGTVTAPYNKIFMANGSLGPIEAEFPN